MSNSNFGLRNLKTQRPSDSEGIAFHDISARNDYRLNQLKKLDRLEIAENQAMEAINQTRINQQRKMVLKNVDEPLYSLLRAEGDIDSRLDSRSSINGDWRSDSILGAEGHIDRLKLII
jgi:hypothetical protein